ncbi:MAG: cation:proton antiporter [Dehalococcoidia bacterium]
MPDLETGFALLAIVLIVSALASGVVLRAPLSFPMIFLGVGVLLGPRGAGVIEISLDDPVLEAVAIITLSLALFIDAVQLRLDELREGWQVPVLTTGPGTLLMMALIALVAMLVLDEPFTRALLIGAALSSLDPVVVRDIARDTRIPGSVRRALSIEAGTDDIIVLPTILILIAVARGSTEGIGDWAVFLLELFLLGPIAGLAVGGVGSWLIGQVDRRIPIPREYQALFGIGLVFAAYVLGEAVGGSGFLAAFLAGFAVVLFNNQLCDCFVEYGETTGEMAMLLAYILLGAVLSDEIGLAPIGAAVLFAVLVLAVARPLAMITVLRRATISRVARLFIAFFGPLGLSSLLLVLVMLHNGVPEADRLFAIVGVVVVISVVVHGMSATPLGAWYGRRLARVTLAEERESTAAGLLRGEAVQMSRISVDELARRLAEPNPPLVLDVRTRSQYALDPNRIPGSVRVPPDQVAEWAAAQDRARAIVAYCT